MHSEATLTLAIFFGSGAAGDGDGTVVRGNGLDAAQPHPPRAEVRNQQPENKAQLSL